MVSQSHERTAFLCIAALILISGASALTIEQAPLNPAFVAYLEGQDTGDILYATGCSGNAGSATGTPFMPYATGDIPAPVLMTWPDTYTTDIYQATATDEATIPARYDLRDEGRVTPVRDQGDCGSCWTFAAYGSLESTYLSDTGQAENFSENNMKNLCSDLYPDGFDGGPCDGGNAFMSAAYLTRGSGPVREEDDPYILPVPSNISPTNLPPVLDTYEVTFLPTRTNPLENGLFKQMLMDEGGIRVRFLINRSCFSGNGMTYYRPDAGYPSIGGHAVTLVGWDDTFPKEEFVVTPPGDGAFILKNSWGTGFGEDGYFYISYYDRSLDTSESTVFTGVAADDERQIYQYDPLGGTTSIGTGTSAPICGANIFTADRYEALTDVSFYTREPETHYAVAICTNFTIVPGDRPPVTWTTGTCSLPGYHTISLPESVPLMPGEVFSVILEVVSPTDACPLVVEMPIEGYSSGATAEAGESYVSTDGSWEDLTTQYPDTNVCIKAHTSPAIVVPRDYATIQDAVDAAVSGDTIFVEAGTYPEVLELEQPVTLLGVGMPVVATPEDGIAVESEADNITIAGFTFDGSGAARGGIGILGNDTTIYDIVVTGYEDGLYISTTEGLTLSATALYDNERNLEYRDILENPGNTIDETVTVNGRPVIYREGVSGEIIDAASDAGAIICVNATDITICDTATEATYDGITLFGCQDVLMENVTADEVYYGVFVYSSENITLQDSSFGPDMTHGMYAMESNRLTVADNDFVYLNSGAGVYLTAVDTATITNNTMSGDLNCIGIWIRVASNITVNGNIIKEGTGYGIGTRNGENMSVTSNTMDSTRYGIMAGDVQTATITGNTIYGNDEAYGFEIEADDTEISGNSAENCSLQALMTLNNSIVRDNFFSGIIYPVFVATESGEDVYIYRNDFVLTAEDIFAGAGMATTMSTDTGWQETMTTTADRDMWGDGYLSDTYADFGYAGDAFGTMAEQTPDSAESADSGDISQNMPVWHSPTEETYWYCTGEFTGYLGNYWSTYDGTDTNYDGVGDTPFTNFYINDTFPLMNTKDWYLNQKPDSGGDDPSADMATSPALNAGDSATLHFTGTAVQTVTVTAAEGTGRIVLTVDQARTGPDGLTGPVYQYLSAQISSTTDDEISEADFSFRVPAAWLRAEGILPADMALWRFHGNMWQELPTSVLRKEGGWVYYMATSPGFSSFAIAEGDGLNVTITTGPAIPDVDTESGTDTADGTVTTESVNETAPEPPVTVAIHGGENTPVESTATPQESPLGLIPFIGGAAGAALLFRKQY